jgi:putative membrane protein
MKRMTTLLVAATMAAAVPALRADEGRYESRATTRVSHGDAKFIRDAAEGNEMEIGLAEIVVRKTQNPQVREYAQHLISDHQQSNRELQQIASERGISWPVAIKKSDAHTLDKYENMSGPEMDRSVMNHWVKDHREDIKEYDKAAKHAQDPQVKQFAISSLPTLRDHLNRAEAITSSGVIRESAGGENHHWFHHND